MHTCDMTHCSWHNSFMNVTWLIIHCLSLSLVVSLEFSMDASSWMWEWYRGGWASKETDVCANKPIYTYRDLCIHKESYKSDACTVHDTDRVCGVGMSDGCDMSRMNTSCHTRRSHVTCEYYWQTVRVRDRCVAFERVMSQWMSHITHEWV